MPPLQVPKAVFTGNTYYQTWRQYVYALVGPTEWETLKKRFPDFANYTAITTDFPARVRKTERDLSLPALFKEVRGTGHGGGYRNYTNHRYVDDCVYDIRVGKHNGRWIGGPFYSYKGRGITRPSPRFDHRSDPYNVPVSLGGPGKFWYSDVVNLNFSPYQGDNGITACRVTSDPRDLFAAYQLANSYVVGARNDADPGRPMYGFGQAIAELRDLPRLLKLAGDTFLQRGGSAFLSYEFGWKPLISDLRSLFNFSKAINDRLWFLQQTKGRPIKRKRVLFDISGCPPTRTSTAGAGYPYGAASVKGGTYNIVDRYRTRAWYSSTIRFDIPDDIPRWRWEQEASKTLMGTQIDGSLLWQITPWSWLIDWFSSVGDIVEREFGSSATTTQFLAEWIMVHAETWSELEVPVVWKAKAASPIESAGYASRKFHLSAKGRQVPTKTSVPLLRLDNILSWRQSAVLFALFLSRGKWDSYGKQ